MSTRPYDSYKSCNIEWLEEIPEHWNLFPLKMVADVRLSNVDKLTAEGQPLVRLCNYVDVYRNETIDESIAFMNASASVEQVDRLTIIAGDVLITKDSESPADIAIPAYTPETLPDLVCGYHLALIRPERSRLHGAYLFRFLQGSLARAKFHVAANGLTRYAISKDDIKGALLPVPPLDEQRAISTFLDRETAKIDALVAEQQRLITLLTEKRQAVISHAVTKGLDPDVPMKDSGIAWLGDVPTHWVVGPLKRHWRVTDCKHLTAEFVDDGIPLASIREVQGKWVNLENAKQTTEHFYNLLIEGDRRPAPGDLIFSRNATVGEVAQVTFTHPPFALGQDVVLLRKVDPTACTDFFQNVLRSEVVVRQLNELMIGSTFKRINVEEIRNISIPYPPPKEQQEISTHLEAITGDYDRLIQVANEAIALFQERRTALISAAVTGQIDVRERVPAEVT